MSSRGRDEVKRVFNRFDTNGDGKISASELAGVIRALEGDSSSSPAPDEIRRMMEVLDADGDGYVDLQEFSDFFLKRDKGGAATDGPDAEEEEELRDAFRMYDLDGDGRISAAELHVVMVRIGERCSVEDCERMIRGVDVNGDGLVDFDEFKKMMSSKKRQ